MKATLGFWAVFLPCCCQPSLAARLVVSDQRNAGSREAAKVDSGVRKALHWLLRTRSRVAKLERSLARSQQHLAIWEQSGGPLRAFAQLEAKDASVSAIANITSDVTQVSSGAVDLSFNVTANDSTQAQDALNATVTALEELERSIGHARHSLSGAESDTVNASLDTPLARQDLLRIKQATSSNSRSLSNLTDAVAAMNASIAADNSNLASLGMKADELVNASDTMGQQATAQLHQIEDVNRLKQQVEDAVTGDSSQVGLLRAEVQNLTESDAAFSKSLGTKVTDYLVRRLRRGTQEVRGALTRMQDGMSPLISEDKVDPTSTQPPLGSDLGLGDDG